MGEAARKRFRKACLDLLPELHELWIERVANEAIGPEQLFPEGCRAGAAAPLEFDERRAECARRFTEQTPCMAVGDAERLSGRLERAARAHCIDETQQRRRVRRRQAARGEPR